MSYSQKMALEIHYGQLWGCVSTRTQWIEVQIAWSNVSYVYKMLGLGELRAELASSRVQTLTQKSTQNDFTDAANFIVEYLYTRWPPELQVLSLQRIISRNVQPESQKFIDSSSPVLLTWRHVHEHSCKPKTELESSTCAKVLSHCGANCIPSAAVICAKIRGKMYCTVLSCAIYCTARS